jgi:hypothetical protein
MSAPAVSNFNRDDDELDKEANPISDKIASNGQDNGILNGHEYSIIKSSDGV